MTVLTLDQAKAACPAAFGEGVPPAACEVCGRGWGDRPPTKAPHGPFTVWACWPCSVRLAKHARQKEASAHGP